jgi:phosphatidylserine/phosphatidylglycerophosphate/cardiolipin synthase-like enzyme
MKLSAYSIDSLKGIITGDSNLTTKRKGPQLISVFNQFGFRDLYEFGGGGMPDQMSRTQYVIRRTTELNDSKGLKGLIEFLVDSRNYVDKPDINQADAVKAINEIIKNDGYRLEDIQGIYRVVGADEPDELESQIHFEDIQNQILEELKKAKYSIWIAVAWFTDPSLLEVLKSKAAQGINVRVIVMDDEINSRAGLKFESFFETYRLKPSGPYRNTMHHKFCVIDLRTVLHGSYNWTVKAQYNKEQLSVETSRELAEQFADRFLTLIPKR